MNCVQITSEKEPKEWKTKLGFRADKSKQWVYADVVFDTGAVMSSISKELFDVLQAETAERLYMKGTTGEEWADSCYLNIFLYDDCVIRKCHFSISNHDMGSSVLLGMDIISMGDFHSFRDSDGLYKCTFKVYENE